MGYRETILLDKPVLYWRLGESAPSGANAIDISGNSRTGTYGAVTSQPGLLANGDNDKAIKGTSSIVPVAINNAAWFPFQGSYSFEAWCIDVATGTLQSLAGELAATISFVIQVNYLGSSASLVAGAISYYTDTGGSDANALSVNSSLADGKPHHVVVTRNAVPSPAVKSIYVDGVQLKQANELGSIGNPATALQVGNQGNSSGTRGWQGTLDEVAVYNYVLSPARVLEHYRAGKGLVGRLPRTDLRIP